MMDRVSKALEIHKEKDFNCAQSVLCAFEDLTGLDTATAAAISEGFGSGVKCGEICGALTGAVMAIGLINCRNGEKPGHNPKIKAETTELMRRFKAENECLTCRELLARRKEKNCSKYISDAVKMLDNIIEGEKQ